MMKDLMNYVEMGIRVRQLRQSLKLTQEQLAEKIGVSTSFIGHIERGEKQCSLDTACKLSVFLGKTLDYIALGIVNQCDRLSCSLYADLRYLFSSVVINWDLAR